MNATQNKIMPARNARADTILQELWAIKAQINKDAGYQTQKIIERAKRYNHQDTLALIKKLRLSLSA